VTALRCAGLYLSPHSLLFFLCFSLENLYCPAFNLTDFFPGYFESIESNFYFCYLVSIFSISIQFHLSEEILSFHVDNVHFLIIRVMLIVVI
jgi:hypothetical protein